MARSKNADVRTLVLSALMVIVGGLAFAACGGGGGERQLIRSFFTASRVDDRGTLGNISMVSFDSRTDGTVGNFSIENVTDESRRTLRMVELSDAVRDALAAEEEHALEMREYQDENIEAIARVIEAERARESVDSADEEVQEMWVQYRRRSAEHSGLVSDAEISLAEESRVPERSAFNPNNPFDVRGYEGELVSKDVSITATVERDGTSEERAMVLTVEKVELGSGEDMIEGRWIISAIN